MTAALVLPPDELLAALRRVGGNVLKCSRALGVGHKSMRTALDRAGISARKVRDLDPDPFVAPRAPPERPGRRRRVSRRPLVRVLAVERCDVVRVGPRGVANGSSCARVVGEYAVPEVTEIVIRNVAVEMVVATPNANRQEFWGQRQRRRARIRRVIRDALGVDWTPPPLPTGWRWLVTFTRYSHLKLDDDNLITAFKSHRDAAAGALGLDDRDPLVTFRVGQAKWSEKGMFRRWDRAQKREVLKRCYRSFFRLRIEQVKG